MFAKTTLVALAAASAAQAAAPQGFNYGATMNGKVRTQADFETDFAAAQKLEGAPGTFNSARLYTMLDGADGTSPIPALKAAMSTKTHLLLGLWMSGDPKNFDKEIDALKAVVNNKDGAYGDLAQYILGISVGSEDLYRISPTGLAAPDAAPGNGPDVITKYIKQARDAISGNSAWAKVPIGHVDTWTAWVNGSNSAVIDNSDFLGVDAYPYWQLTEDNGVDNGKNLFNEAMDNTKGVANGKPVWITETGWAVTGPKEGKAEAGKKQAQTYWQEVACPNLGNTPTFWYTLYDGVSGDSTPSFSVSDASFKPLFDLSCSNVKNSTNTSSSATTSATGTSTATAASGFTTATGSPFNGTANGTYTGSPSSPSGTASSGSGSSSSSSSGSSGSGSSASGSAAKPSGSGIATSGASSLSFSLSTMAAIAAAAVAFL